MFVHEKSDKLQPWAIRCIFLGYPNVIKGYRCWDTVEKRCIVSRDVKFNEDELGGLSKKESECTGRTEVINLDLGGEVSNLNNPHSDFQQENSQTQVDEHSLDDNEVDENDLQNYQLAREIEKEGKSDYP
ncbi:hypothetical protein Patl1_04575 [Pistacia atlantica]|uniref:Uncharacterized protein n=1 Tax=Pistacia atlantica TaxID=434234 RepID=A0ACC1BTE5_9ROSI|nr:hypothetical protein Patl1_04575 [Pistacia atlantica]